jgi:hypothetical protein
MKKILIILLALTLAVGLASCKKDDPTPAPAAPTVDLAAYQAAVANTSLVSANITVTASNDFFPNDPLFAEYDVEFKDDGSAVVNFTYMEYNEIKPGEDKGIYSTYNGYATISPDGTVTGSQINASVTAAASVNFNLDGTKMTVSEDHGILRANIPAANTASVLGGAIGADVVLTLTVANGAVAGATINYVLNGVSYEIVCTYN